MKKGINENVDGSIVEGNKKNNDTATVRKGIIIWIKIIVFAVIVVLFIMNFSIINAVVPTGSMEKSIMPKDRIIATRLAYLFEEPQKFDIIIFKLPDNEKVLDVKRLIGLPGETVEVKAGKVYINGSDTPLVDSFTKEEPVGDFGPYVVPEGHYFMMGDNRNQSADSRYWQNTFLSKDKILGKVIFRIYPSFKLYNNDDFINNDKE